MKKNILLIIFFFCLLIVNAQVRTTVNVCYKHSNGTYSEYITREVQFKTGISLNNAVGKQNYDKDADYALIWYGQGEVAIIKLDNQILQGLSRYINDIDKTTFDLYCNMHHNLLKGTDQEGKIWKICTLTGTLASLCQ